MSRKKCRNAEFFFIGEFAKSGSAPLRSATSTGHLLNALKGSTPRFCNSL